MWEMALPAEKSLSMGGKVYLGHIVFLLAGLDTQAAPNTLLYVNAHSVEVIGWIILSVPGFCLGILQKVPKHSSGGNKQNGIL